VSATSQSQGDGVTAFAKKFVTFMRAHSMRNNNQILHGDQTIAPPCDKNYYPVDHE